MELTHLEALKLAYDYYVLKNKDGDPRTWQEACYCESVPRGEGCVPCKLRRSIASTDTPQGIPLIKEPVGLRDEFAKVLMPMLLRTRFENVFPFITEAMRGMTLDEMCDENHPIIKKVKEISDDAFLAAAQDAYRAADRALTARIPGVAAAAATLQP